MKRFNLNLLIALLVASMICWIFDIHDYRKFMESKIEMNWRNFFLCSWMFSIIFSVYNHKEES